MSNYFRSLKRLDAENAKERAQPAAPAIMRVETPEAAPIDVTPPPMRVTLPPPPPPQPTPPPQTISGPGRSTVQDERLVGGYAALFDNLRVLGNGVPLGAIVLAGASDGESCRRVADGLANEVIRNRLTAAIAELSRAQTRPTLRMRMTSSNASANEPGAASAKVQLDLRSGSLPNDLVAWLGEARARHDVVIVEAPPLGLSGAAAVVARACDGLVLVVEPRATASAALLASVERAEAVGCRILGIVTQGENEKLPKWLRQIVNRRSLF
jgi:hypothetical protein